MASRKSLVAAAVFVAFFAVTPMCFAMSAISNDSTSSVQWTDHSAIRIIGDDNFTSENGVVGGSGTKSDPYIIEGWKIGPFLDGTGIFVMNTTVYFSIKDVNVSSCSIGVYLNTVQNGRVEDSVFNDNGVGVALYGCDSCKVIGNTFTTNGIAISINSSDASQSDNSFIDNDIDVVRPTKKAPWIETWVGAALCVSVMIPFAVILALLLYFRYKRIPPPPQ